MSASNCRIFILFLALIFGVASSNPSYAVDPRIKSLGIMAAYGTVGGALLGTASLAFGSDGRSVARGASIGLYTGLLFGSYVVLSHAYRQRGSSDPGPDPEPYGGNNSYGRDRDEEEEDSKGGLFDNFEWGWGSDDDDAGGSEEGYEDDYPQRWNPYLEMGNLRHSADSGGYHKLRPSKTRPVYYINLFNYQF